MIVGTCYVACRRADITHGQVRVWQPMASYPARTVQYLIIARDIGDQSLVDKAVGALTIGHMELPGGSSVDVRKSAEGWAKQYAKALGFPVPLE